LLVVPIRVTRCVCEKVVQNVAQPVFCQNKYVHTEHILWEKVAHKFVQLLKFSKKRPKKIIDQ
jgi:hypothetical protein